MHNEISFIQCSIQVVNDIYDIAYSGAFLITSSQENGAILTAATEALLLTMVYHTIDATISESYIVKKLCIFAELWIIYPQL